MFTLAISSCPNDTIAFYDLIHHSDFAFKLDIAICDIGELNEKLLKNEADFCKASFFAFFQQIKNYSLLASGNALGNKCGPLIVGKGKKELTSATTIAIPGELTTANLLFSLCYPQIKNKKIMRFDKIINAVQKDEVDAGLIIHESRFTYKKLSIRMLVRFRRLVGRQNLLFYSTWSNRCQTPTPFTYSQSL